MGFVSIDLSEIHDLASDLRRAGDSIQAKVETAVKVGGHRVVAAAQYRAPVDTGALKSSISVDVDGLRFEAGPSIEYGIYQELGTSEMPPQPFLGPGFDVVEPLIVEAIADAGSRIL